MSLQKLESNYRNFLNSYKSEKQLDILEAKNLLNTFRQSGEFISSPEEREILSVWCRTIADIIFENTGEYLPVRIFPLDNITISSEPASIPLPRQIPPPPADFKGRKDEIINILLCFDKVRPIIGLRGMAGVGKTALALVLAERLKDRFPDGNLFLNLQGTTSNPLRAADAMAQVIHSYYPTKRLPEREDELRGLYLSVLSDKRVLLLLDNAKNREQVEPLLPPSSCAVLITSRNKFSLPGLTARDLDVLSSAEARELLLEIAGRIGDRSDNLANLCGNLPLALRNAASVLAERGDIDVADYERCLSDKKMRLDLVYASFSLTYDLLSPVKKKHWCRLSVFPQDFDLKGGTAVLKMALEPSAKVLSDLVKCSLVDFIRPVDSGEGRYKLHDLARLFAESRLESKERDDAEHCHAKYYLIMLSSAETLYNKGGENVMEGLKILDREWANVQAGQAFAVKNAKKNADAAALCIEYADPVGILSLRLHPNDLIHWLEVSLDAAKQLKRSAQEGIILTKIGYTYFQLGKVQEAIHLHEKALTISRKIGARRGEGTVLGNLGQAYAALGETRKVIEYSEHALAIDREIGNKKGEDIRLGNLGCAYYDLGEMHKAIEYYEQALTIDHEIGDRRSEGKHLGDMGLAYASLGKTREAIEYYKQALNIACELGDLRTKGRHMGNLGGAYYDLGYIRKAIEHYEQALAISREIGNPWIEGENLCNLGNAYAALEDTNKAIIVNPRNFYLIDTLK